MKIKCEKCGIEVDLNDSYCSDCGSKFLSDAKSDFVSMFKKTNIFVQNFPKNIASDEDMREKIGSDLYNKFGELAKICEKRYGISIKDVKINLKK